MNTLTKEQWIEETAALLCQSQGAETEEERKNCHILAEDLWDYEEEQSQGDPEMILSPQEAHDNEVYE